MSLKRCKSCKEPFTPSRQMQSVCGYGCGLKLAEAKRLKAQAKKEQDERRQTKAKLESLKTLPQLKKEAQIAFNAFIRRRDAGKRCISCDSLLPGSGIGGGYDCGHFRSVGSAPHLRYDPDNAHGQCKHCNRYGAGRVIEYRRRLIERCGIATVERLEADNTPKHWTRDELREIRANYRAMTKELERAST